MTRKEKLTDIALLLGTAFAVITALFADFARECGALHDSTFRLHIVANSDSPEDQSIKYAVRDYILTDLSDIFADCPTAADAEASAAVNAAYIAARVGEYLADRECDYAAAVSVGEASFPTRAYAGLTLPSGSYRALRVVLGEGRGKNWWCVLYPTMCIGAAGAEKTVLPSRELYERRKRLDRLTADSLRTERGGIEFRFALYDLLRSLFGKGE